MEPYFKKITINMPDSSKLELDVDINAHVGYLITEICEKTKLTADDFRLTIPKRADIKYTVGFCLLPYYNIAGALKDYDNSINLLLRKGGVPIMVKKEGLPEFEIDMDYNDSIYDVKAMIEKITHDPIESQTIVWAGKELNTERRGLDYCLMKNSTIHLIVKK
jgi:hypothetical protein